MNRHTRKLLGQAFRISGATKIFCAYGVFFFVVAVLIRLIDPDISTIGEGVWYCFETATTIGFGDIHVATPAARILTIILSLYSIGVAAIFTAVITSFFMETAKARVNDNIQEFLYDMEHLPELSQEELRELSEKVKNYHSRIK